MTGSGEEGAQRVPAATEAAGRALRRLVLRAAHAAQAILEVRRVLEICEKRTTVTVSSSATSRP